MALIRSKLRFFLPKTSLKPFCSSPAVEPHNHKNDEDEDHHRSSMASVDANLSPMEAQMADKFYSIIKDHYRLNPNPNKYPLNPDPNPLSPSFTIPSLSTVFSDISSGDSVSSSVVTSVVERCRKVRYGIPFSQALTFFNWVPDEVIPLEAYGEMVELAGKVGRFDIAWSLIDLMKSRHLAIPLEVFLNLIRRYVRRGKFSEAVDAFNRIEDYGCPPNLAAFTAVISVLCKERKAYKAQAFFDKWKGRFEPDVVVYTTLMSGWYKAGKISKAEKIFGEMKAAGIEPSVFTYSVVIDSLCRRKEITRAQDIFAEMIEKGCEPDAVIFNNLMRAHVKAGKTEKVLEVYDQMKSRGCTPDTYTYNFLIETHCKDGKLDEAIQVIDEMVSEMHCAPNAHSFNPIFRSISRKKDVDSAHQLFAKMKELNCQPNTVTFNTLMDIFVKSKLTDKVLKLKEEMDELRIDPNVNTYEILISMCCEMGDWSNADKYFREMIEEKCLNPSSSLYDTVLQQLTKAGELKKHEELVEKMVERGFAERPTEV